MTLYQTAAIALSCAPVAGFLWVSHQHGQLKAALKGAGFGVLVLAYGSLIGWLLT